MGLKISLFAKNYSLYYYIKHNIKKKASMMEKVVVYLAGKRTHAAISQTIAKAGNMATEKKGGCHLSWYCTPIMQHSYYDEPT